MGVPQPFRIMSKPGIKRDGTLLEGDEYKDGLWCRFSRRGLPRKIGGFQAITSRIPELVRGMDSFYAGGLSYVSMGSQSFLTQLQVDQLGNAGNQNDRTPSGFAANANNLWQVDYFFNTATAQTAIVAHAGQNLSDISATVETPIYYGAATATTPLVATGMDPVSGGIVAVAPYLIAYSNNGRVDVTGINDLITPPNSAFVSDTKIIRGLPLRNGSGGPAALLWSLSDLIIMTYNPGLLAGIPFNFNTLSNDVSAISSSSIIEMDGIYYWPESDHFSMFNGIVRELPNTLNVDFFFKNLNYSQRQKVFAFRVQAASEIWWCFPYGQGQIECNHAVIYNTFLNTWYDTALPDSGRTAGVSPAVTNKPLLADADQQPSTAAYTLWQHETGFDKTISGSSFPVRSYFKTNETAAITAPQPKDVSHKVSIVEPDFAQKGDMIMSLWTRANASCTPVQSAVRTLSAVPSGPQQQVEYWKHGGRLMAFQFESNVLGGDYYMGHVIAHIEETDGRYTS